MSAGSSGGNGETHAISYARADPQNPPESPHAGWPSQKKVNMDIKESLAWSKREKSTHSQRSVHLFALACCCPHDGTPPHPTAHTGSSVSLQPPPPNSAAASCPSPGPWAPGLRTLAAPAMLSPALLLASGFCPGTALEPPPSSVPGRQGLRSRAHSRGHASGPYCPNRTSLPSPALSHPNPRHAPVLRVCAAPEKAGPGLLPAPLPGAGFG